MVAYWFAVFLYGAVYETHGPFATDDLCERARQRIEVIGPEGPVLTIGRCEGKEVTVS
jgi:hypothetical protein